MSHFDSNPNDVVAQQRGIDLAIRVRADDDARQAAKPPGSRAMMLLLRNTPKTFTLIIPPASILLYDGQPIAIANNGVVSFCGTVAATQKAANAFQPDVAHLRVTPETFRFTLGQALVQAGLPLTLLPESR